MGTLFDQEPRQKRLEKEKVEYVGEQIKAISKSLEITFSDALNLYLAVAKIDDYDSKDEQLSDFGKLFEQLIDTLSHNGEEQKQDK